ncbi:hypothetical protein Dxin01_00299 [Deinococcus xinjiangensis]|uniref:Uncharacterized protein n=2 Tax=Deinococcus xinjiangensis TaxID=457454 RepID=A0ABP9V5L4_9DEIO
MTVYSSNTEFFVGGLHHHKLSARQHMLLNLCLDFLLDPSKAKTLNQALHGSDPLDVMRMLAQQWSLGLSTLSGDLDYQQPTYLKPSFAASFIEGIKAALQADQQLINLPNDPKVIYNELLRHMAKNQPHHAAWCAAMLWQRPLNLN